MTNQRNAASVSDPWGRISQLERELALLRAAQQDLVYAVSHDMRAPLRHITAFTQVIAEDLPHAPPDILAHLATIRQSAQLMAQQLDGLTQLSRLGLQPLNLQPVDVATLVQAVAAQVTAVYPQQPVQWQWAPDVPAVYADAALLRQVLLQVLDNAVKFSRGCAPAQVALTWQLAEDGQCQINITDQGVGFAPEQAAALFKVFGKLHPARVFAGLGMGLVTCQKIMQRLGGSIQVAGVAGQGCRVGLTLPCAR